MTVEDHRTIWKEKNDLELMVLIQEFIEFESITSVRDYQNGKKSSLIRCQVYGLSMSDLVHEKIFKIV